MLFICFMSKTRRKLSKYAYLWCEVYGVGYYCYYYYKSWGQSRYDKLSLFFYVYSLT